MNVAVWAEIRRLSEMDKLSGRVIAQRLHCSRHTVATALELQQPPTRATAQRASLLDPYVAQIKDLLAKYPDLSAVRIREEIARGPQGYAGSASVLRRYLRRVRPARGRVYQEVHYEPAQAMQVDWGECGRVQVGSTTRKVSVFVAVLCYSRLLFIEFTLSQRKAEFYRGLVNALTFFGGSPRNLIFDNLKAAVLNGSGRSACFHPEFLALCGYFCLQPVACARRDPESKGIVEGSVRYVKHNALAGRADELTRFEDYLALAPYWRDQVANLRQHETTRARPCYGRCRLSPSTPTKSCRPSSVHMPASPSTAIAIPCRRSSCADRSPCALTGMSCACCTKARWWRNTSAVTNAASC
jgi:transposase